MLKKTGLPLLVVFHLFITFLFHRPLYDRFTRSQNSLASNL
ncbi:hypothetical protein BLGI_644 [Brevibacillus laterosporus GI-9]|nr:hypothetical protein BLGI_644 [Brevibacillus laterosporus GI-9]